MVDLDDAPLRPEIVDALRSDGIGHVLLAALRVADRFTGLLGLGWPAAPAARPTDAIVLQAAALIAASLENARLVERLEAALVSERRLADEQAVLQSLTQIGERAGQFEELAATTIRQVVTMLGAPAGSYMLLPADDRVVHAAYVGLDEAFVRAADDQRASQMLSLSPLFAGSPSYVEDYGPGIVRPRGLTMAAERGLRSFGVIPIHSTERLEGAIVLYFDRPSAAVGDLQRVLAAISRIAGISLANFRLRERLVASEGRYRVLFEESPDAIVVLDGGMELLQANRAALALFGVDIDGLRTFMASGLGLVDDKERQRRREVVDRDGRGTFRDTGARPDGSTFPEEVEIVRVDVSGEPRYLVIIRDLTEPHQLQQELLQAQKMEAIGQLVSGVAHELNNPLAAIVAFSQLLRRDERLPDDMHRDADSSCRRPTAPGASSRTCSTSHDSVRPSASRPRCGH